MSRNVCIVTGASRGIGRATALAFAREGYDLLIAARSKDALAQTAAQVRETGAACETLAADVATRAGCEQLVNAALDRFGRLDVLVNNAGAAPMGPIESFPDEDFDAAVGVNIAAVFYATRAAWGPLVRSGGGVIVNVSSVASVDPFTGFAVYGGCKAWVNTFTRAVAEEGRPHNVRVFAVAPGAVDTQMLRQHFPDFPAAQCLRPEDVAATIVAVTRPELAHATGQTIFVRR